METKKRKPPVKTTTAMPRKKKEGPLSPRKKKEVKALPSPQPVKTTTSMHPSRQPPVKTTTSMRRKMTSAVEKSKSRVPPVKTTTSVVGKSRALTMIAEDNLSPKSPKRKSKKRKSK